MFGSGMMLRIDEIAEVFHDVTPIPQADPDQQPVCGIMYPTSFLIAFDYMRACWKSEETSERSLKLTATCLKLNPANYTVWHFRRKCLRALGRSGDQASLSADLTLTSQLGGSNPKNYQIWYHRRVLLEDYHKSSPNPTQDKLMQAHFLDSELDYLAEVLNQDPKNYHAWSNRQWLLKTVNDPAVWDAELLYVDGLLEKDPWNNSAWNERWLAVHRAVAEPLEEEVFRREADYALEGAKTDPYNECPYRYLLGMLQEQRKKILSSASPQSEAAAAKLFAEYLPRVEGLKEVLLQSNRSPEECINWISAKIDILEAMKESHSLQEALRLAKTLENEQDQVREVYWMRRISELKQQLAVAVE